MLTCAAVFPIQVPQWLLSLLWSPISLTWLAILLAARFSRVAFLLAVSAATYHWVYCMFVPPSLSELHPINFHFPATPEDRRGGVPANATVDFAFQRQLMLRAGARGMDWSSGMSPGSSLDIGVSLQLPDCSANFAVGFAPNPDAAAHSRQAAQSAPPSD